MRSATVLIFASACQIIEPTPPPAELGTFPYHPLVFELDLSILAYQLHGQSLVWPIDPYYEEHAGGRGTSRDRLMELVKAWAHENAGGAYRGPGVLVGLANNATHDPILYDYARLHPWSPALMNAQAMWTEYLTPDAITRRIRDVFVAARAVGGEMAVTQMAPGRIDSDADATDVLCAFEGGTGSRGDEADSWSLMGNVLARDTPTGWDAHVSFRGSRSGDAIRAATDALDSSDLRGNPDWITDLGWDIDHPDDVTTVGGVHRGFARSMRSILPGVTACLATIGDLRATPPTNIYLTGHSLGGGLAQHFASAILLGTTGAALPEAVRAWPWDRLKLVTFSAPRAGDYRWAEALSGRALESPFYDPGPLETVDADARLVLDPGIVERLHDAERPAAFRVLVSTDPITTTKFGGDGTHVGTTVYVNGTSFIDWLGVDNTVDHEPITVRADMLAQMTDPRTPAIAWRYRELSELAPDRDESEKGTPAEMEKLAAGLRAYYRERGAYFDEAAFDRDVELLFDIERDPKR